MQQSLTDQFIQERTYFKNVTPKTIAWYRQSFHAFEGAMDTRSNIGDGSDSFAPPEYRRYP